MHRFRMRTSGDEDMEEDSRPLLPGDDGGNAHSGSGSDSMYAYTLLWARSQNGCGVA
jgi:hypothetical protein